MNRRNNFKKMLSLIAIAGFAFFAIASGNGGDNNEESYDKNVGLKPNEKNIKGYLSDVFEIVDGTYEYNYTGSRHTGEGKIQVKIKSVGKGDLKDYGLQDGNSGSLYLTICDKNGTPLTDFSDIASEYKSDDLLKDMMTKIGEENWVAFHGRTYQGKRLPDDAATFVITSKKIEKREDNNSSSYEDSDSEIDTDELSSSSNDDYDELLDNYEAYVDKYIEFLKKANKGDMSAMQEYPDLMGKAQDLEKSLKKAENQKTLTASQMKRMLKIQNKITNAAIDMQK